MLSDVERRVLATHCADHTVATCDDCDRDYKLTELGFDTVWHRYYFCPSCRNDLVDELRLHILGCPVIAAALEEQLERTQQLIKESDRLATVSAILAAESRALAQRALELKRDPPATSALVQRIAGILAEPGGICAHCLGRHAALRRDNVLEYVEAISSHIRITSKPGTCRECGRQDVVLSFDDGTSGIRHAAPAD